MIDFSKYFAYDETSPSCLRWIVDRFSGRNMSIKHISKGDVADGIMVATRLAILKRRELVKSLEEFGIYYSERHGK